MQRMFHHFQQRENNKEVNNTNSKTSLCTINRIVHQKSYIVKVFPLNGDNKYQKEKNLLQTLDHPNIIKPIGSNERQIQLISNKYGRRALVFSKAKFGNFFNYLQSCGSFSEQVTKFYLKQIVRALSYVNDKVELNHPNLNLENLLMKQDRDVLICGWSNSKKDSQKQLSFVIARMAIQMITERDPLTQGSHFLRYLSEKQIHKFWTQLEKSLSHKQKAFPISEEFKKNLSLVLLNQLLNFEEIEKLLYQEQFTLQDVQVELENNNKFKASKWASQEEKP